MIDERLQALAHRLLVEAGFREFKSSGWPLCPVCEEDEVYTLANDPERTPALKDLLVHAACYRCARAIVDRRDETVQTSTRTVH